MIESASAQRDAPAHGRSSDAVAVRSCSRTARVARGVAMLALASLLTACIYRLPIRQGNYLDPAAIAQVKPGMTHSQVRYLLGTPMVPESFDNARWDYDYYLNDHSHKPRRAHATVYFFNDLVSQVQADVRRKPDTTVTRSGIPIPNSF
jgi:outer membrane protein assembly factor BamE